MASQTLSEPIQKELFEIRGFDVVLLPRISVLTLILGDASWKTGVLGKTLDTIKQAAIRVARRTLDSVTIQEIFDECTTAHNDLHRNRGFSPWQLLLGKTPTDKSVYENPDLVQCSAEAVDEASKQRLRVKKESYKAYIEEELSLRKRRKEIHQTRPWRHWAAGAWCWCLRSGKHKASRIKGGVFLGPSCVLLHERETTAEGVRMKGVVWVTEGTSLVRCAPQHLFSLSESENRSHRFPRPCKTFATQHVS